MFNDQIPAPTSQDHFELFSIVEGLMIGVGVWIVTLAYLFVSNHAKKRKQKRYIRQVIQEQTSLILNAQPTPLPTGQTVPADVVRKTIFEELNNDMKEILDRGASHIDFEDILQIRKVFRMMNWAMNAGGQPRTPNRAVYQYTMVANLNKVSWLHIR